MKHWFTFIFVLFVAVSIHAQHTVSGHIADLKTKEALLGAIVIIDTPTNAAVTDFDGNFEINNIPSGTHTLKVKYVSYAAYQQTITVGDATLKVDINMTTETKEIKETVVKTERRTNTEAAVITEMRKTDAVMTAVSSAQIARTADRTAAEVVKRVPGVTIQDDRFIIVRGLNQRYNDVWLNDATAPSSETDERAFSFDVVPSGMIDRIQIFKTPSAELPGDFAGGMVKIYTKSLPEKNGVSGEYATSFREGSTFKPFYYNQGSPTDMLGYDNGYRAIPANAPAYINKNDSNNVAVANGFKNNWGIKQTNLIPDQRANLNFYGTLKLKRLDIGNVTALTYSLTGSTYMISRRDFDSTSTAFDVRDIQSVRTVNAGIMENIAFRFSTPKSENKMEVKVLFNQNGKERVTQRTNQDTLSVPSTFYGESYTQRTTLLTQLTGNHSFNKEKTFYTYSGSFALSDRNDPDLKRIQYTTSGADTVPKAAVPAGTPDLDKGGGRLYRRLKENIFSFNHMLKQKIKIGNYQMEISAGNFIEYKYRDYSSRFLGYTIKTGQNSLTYRGYSLDSIFDPSHFGAKDQFRIDENTSPSDNYKAQNMLVASFLNFYLPVTKSFKIVAGLRYEYNKQSLQGAIGSDTVTPSVVTHFFLPSINMSYTFHKNMLVRAAYGMTVNRPEFREWSPLHFYDDDTKSSNYGALFQSIYFEHGDTLKVAKIHNADLRYEFYPAPGDVIQVGAFFKYFIDPIQRVGLPVSADSRSYTFINADHAYLYGFELDLRKNLGFHDNKIAKQFSLILNAAYIQSQLTLPTLVNQVKTTAFQGQSPYIVNAGLYYQNDSIGLAGAIIYNVSGPRIYALGSSTYGNIAEMPRHSLDITISYTLKKIVTFTFAAQNLIDAPVRYVLDINRDQKYDIKGMDKAVIDYRTGRYYTASIKFKLEDLKKKRPKSATDNLELIK